MIFHKSTYNDIVKYYSDNVIKLKETEDRLWQIVSIRPNEVMLVDVDGFNIYLDLSEEYEVNYPLPGRVVYQYGNTAALLLRKPAKQYNRGIHSHNTALYYLHNGKWNGLELSLHTLQHFVDKPAYQDPNNLDESYTSWAINQWFSLNQTQLYCLNKKIGDVLFENKTIMLYNPILMPEVKAAFPKWSVKDASI